MSEIIHALKKYKHEYGDFIYGDEGAYSSPWLGKFNKKLLDLNLLHLGYIYPNTWSSLFRFGVMNAAKIHNRFSYECPYTKLKYCAVAPIAIATETPLEEFFKDEQYKPWYYDMLVDKEWNERHNSINPNDIIESVGGVMKAYMGSGYTDGCMINDGSYSYDISTLDIDNGDKVICANLVWHNK